MSKNIRLCLLVSIISLHLSLPSLAMEDDLQEVSGNGVSIKRNTHEDEKTNSQKSRCSHWGLSHWFSGITEYFERSCCGDTKNDEGRKYITKSKDNSRIIQTSDCFWIAEGQRTGGDGGFDPLSGTYCCPFMTIGHLCCLPFACCECSENQETRIVESSVIVSPPPQPVQTQEEREKAYQEWRMREWNSGDLDRRLKANWIPELLTPTDKK